MIYSLLVMADPACGSAARHAVAFARAAIQRGHTLHRVFFLDEGTRCSSATAVYPQDEPNPVDDWAALASDHGVELILCITSALRQGQLDTQEAARHEREAPSIHPAFTISGLGQLIDATATSDRLVTFGG